MAMVRKYGELGVMMAEAWQRGTVEMRTVQPEADSYHIYSSYAMPRQANRMLRIDPCCSQQSASAHGATDGGAGSANMARRQTRHARAREADDSVVRHTVLYSVMSCLRVPYYALGLKII